MREYFNRFHNILYVIILVPLVLLTYFYLETQKSGSNKLDPSVGLQHWIFSLLFLAGFFYSSWYFRTQLKNIRMMDLLEEKLKLYKRIMIIRYFSIALGCLLLAAGFWLGSHSVYITLFMMGMIAFSAWWPSPEKICKDLLLKGEDREKVLHFRKAP